jgi:acyl-CoA thioesterase
MDMAETRRGLAVIEIACREELLNSQGVMHGGFISTLADSAMARAMATVVPEGARHSTFDLKMNFVSAVKSGEKVRAKGTVLHHGRRTGVVECRVECGERLVATATASFIIQAPGGDSASAD